MPPPPPSPEPVYYFAPTNKIADAFKWAYTDFVQMADGSDHVPLQDRQDRSMRRSFRNTWFKHKDEPSYVYLCGAKTALGQGDQAVTGMSEASYNYSFVYSAVTSTEGAKITVPHELGHQFDVDEPDTDHVDMYAYNDEPLNTQPNPDYVEHRNHSNTDLCIMDYEFFGTIAEFCDLCISRIRNHADPI